MGDKQTASEAASKARAELSRSRKWIFRIIAMSLPLIAILMLEITLRMIGYGYPTSFLIEHPSKPEYLVDNYQFAWRFFPKQLARSPQPIVCTKQKPDGAVRILVFGGSAAMGDPEVAHGMPRVLQIFLEHRFPNQKFEVINCAVTAINSHVVRSIVQDCRQLDADAWLIYLGNNEVHGPFGAGTVFGGKNQSLAWSRFVLATKETKLGQALFQLRGNIGQGNAPQSWGGMEMFREQKIPYDAPALQHVYQNFEDNLTAIVEAAPQGTKVLLSSVVTNLSDFAPFISLHANLSSDELARWQEAYRRGSSFQDQKNYAEALKAFEEAEQIDSTFAELEFRQGQCLQRTGNIDEAMRKFRAARNHDALRFRADSQINQIIRDTAAKTTAKIVDAEKRITAVDGTVGNDLLYEHVHFNFEGNYRLAELFADQLLEEVQINKSSALATWPSREACIARLVLSPFHERLTLQDVQGRLSAPPFKDRYDQAKRMAELSVAIDQQTAKMTPEVGRATFAAFEESLKQRPDWLHHQQFGILKDAVGDRRGAANEFRKITKLLPHRPEGFFRLGAQLNRLKEYKNAEVPLRKAIELRSDFVRARNSLGISLSHQGEFDACYEQFQTAVELQPTFTEAYVNWGLVLVNQGQNQAALEKFQEVLTISPSHQLAQQQIERLRSSVHDREAHSGNQ